MKRIEMNFLPDVYVTCDVCKGKRYNLETLQVKYRGYSISNLLEATVEEAVGVLENIPNIQNKLRTLCDVGLGYIHLGQSSTTLSGGEAQRIKLARELSKRQTGKTLYILDEPTTGLHFEDVRRLLEVLHRLVDLGNTVIVIEHHLDVIKTSDWIIDLGPEGGEAGGHVVACGTPEQLLKARQSYTAQALMKVMQNGKVA
jgi:excinuclease ABC subunit A